MAYLGRRGATAALTTGDIPDNSITAAKIVVDTITAGDLAPNSVDSSELVDGSVDLSHMSANSVDSNQYVDGSIDTIHIDNDQVTADKLANSINTDIATGVAALPKSGGTMSGNIVMGDDTSIGIADDAERIEFDGAGDISVLGAKFGIGTASPYGALDIQCSDRCQIVSSGPTNDAALWVTNSGQETGGSSLQVYTNSAHTGTRNVCKITNDHASATGTTALYVQQDSTGPAAYFGGNVGIGTAAPVAKLDILSNGSATQSSISAVAANGAYMINGAYTANQYYPMIGVRMNDNNSSVVNAGMYAQFTNSGSNLILGGSNSYSGGIAPHLFIRYDGNVGIGTAAPGFPLQVEGGIYLNGGSNFLRFGADSSAPLGEAIHRPAAGTLAFLTASVERMRIDSDGNVALTSGGSYSSGLMTKNTTGSGSKAVEGHYSVDGNYSGDGTVWFVAQRGKSYHIEAGFSGYQGNSHLQTSFYMNGSVLYHHNNHSSNGYGTCSAPTVTIASASGAYNNTVYINFPYTNIDHPLMWWKIHLGGNPNLLVSDINCSIS
jgi:hypothetical protein